MLSLLLFCVFALTLGVAIGLLLRANRFQGGAFVVLVASPACGGALIGYVVGLSDSPVVAGLIPLLIGLVSAIGYVEVRKRYEFQVAREAVAGAGLEPEMLERVESAIGTSAAKDSLLLTFTGIGTSLFFVSCYFGLAYGIDQRLPHYEIPRTLLQQDSPLTPLETMGVVRASQHLRRQRVTPGEHDLILNVIFEKAFKAKDGQREVQVELASDLLQAVSLPKDGAPNDAPGVYLKTIKTDELTGLQNEVEAGALTYEEAVKKLLAIDDTLLTEDSATEYQATYRSIIKVLK